MSRDREKMNMVEEDDELDPAPGPEELEIDIGELTMLHTAKFTLNTNIGPIVLRALSRKKAGKIGQQLLMADPSYALVVKEYNYLKDIKAYPDGLNEEQTILYADLTRQLSEWSDWFAIECFVKPVLTHVDQLEALSSELDTENFNQLDEMLNVLANPMPPSEANRQIGEICVEYGVPMADGITADNLTVQQAAVIDDAVAAQNEKLLAAQVEAMKIG